MRYLLLTLALFLTACGSNPGDELIRVASSNMQVDVMQADRIMREHPEAVKYANSEGTTPLHASCANWNFIITVNLLKAGADPNARDKKGNTPLHYALGAIEGMNYGSSQNLPGTPLTAQQQQARGQVQSAVAVNQARNREDIVRYLLNAKADVNITNNEGKTPLQFSEQSEAVYREVAPK